MLYMMFAAHLLGDYVFQWGLIARWKARSLLGVAAHGGIVTLTTLTLAMLVDAHWWPYALAIGISHTLIDVVRARFVHTTHPTGELTWYLLDQLAHLAVIVLVVTTSRPTNVGGEIAARALTYAVGYLLLVNPAWVLLRFTVRGVWGADAAPCLGKGEKYGPMIERVLIATLVLIGQMHLIPLVLLPRHLIPIRTEEQQVGVLLQAPEHWAESTLSVALAAMVGLGIRLMETKV